MKYMNSMELIRRPLHEPYMGTEATKAVNQSILYKGRLVEKPAPADILCKTCDKPVIEAMSCPCHQSIMCRTCIERRLLINSGLALNKSPCSNCDMEQRHSNELREQIQPLYQRVSSAIEGGVNTTGFDWTIIPYTGYDSASQKAFDRYYQPLMLENSTLPLQRRPLHSPAPVFSSFQAFSHDGMNQFYKEQGIVDLSSNRERTSEWETGETITRGSKQTVKFDGWGLKIDYRAVDSCEDVADSFQVLAMPGSGVIHKLISDNNLNYSVISGSYLLRTLKPVDGDITMNIEHCLSLPTGCLGRFLTRIASPIQCIVMDSSKTPLEFKTLKVTVDSTSRHASVTMTAPTNPVFIALVRNPPTTYPEADERKTAFSMLDTLPLPGSSRFKNDDTDMDWSTH